jgi:BSD domain
MFAITKRQKAEAEVEKRRGDINTYTQPLDYGSDPNMKDFLMNFYKHILFKKQAEMKQLLLDHPNTIGKFFKQLVPSQMENEDFWQRYYYRVKTVDEILAEWDPPPNAPPPVPSIDVELSTSSGGSRRGGVTSTTLQGEAQQYALNRRVTETTQSILTEVEKVRQRFDSKTLNKLDQSVEGRGLDLDESETQFHDASEEELAEDAKPKATATTTTKSDDDEASLGGSVRSLGSSRRSRASRRSMRLTGEKPQLSAARMMRRQRMSIRADQTGGEPPKPPDAPVLVGFRADPRAFPDRRQTRRLTRSMSAKLSTPSSGGAPPDHKSFFENISKMYYDNNARPSIFGDREQQRKALGISSPPASVPSERHHDRKQQGWSRHWDDSQDCGEICYHIVFALVMIFVIFVLFLLFSPDHARSVGDGMCAPIAPYQTLSTDKGKIGIAPWWVFPSSSKPFIFDALCGDDRIRTMLVWAPKHEDDKEFRLVIGDLSEKETVLRLSRLDRVKVYPNKLIPRQSGEAMDDEEDELPEEFNAAWMKGWNDEDIIADKRRLEPFNETYYA